MRQIFVIFFGVSFAFLSASFAQSPGAAPAKPDQHVLGTIVTIGPESHRITVKEDKAGTAYTISLEKTRTLLKVAPGAKDLKGATRITAGDLAVGDRVDIRGFKADDTPNSIAAASVILMSARDLQQARQAEMTEWRQRGITGIVLSVDTSNAKLNVSVRTPQGLKSIVVDMPVAAQLTRYSPGNPKAPIPSKLSEIQTGDQVRILGNKSADGSTITAEKIYSGSFRTIAGTIASISPDANQITVTDLATKQPVQVLLTPDSAIRKLPPQAAAMLARRSSPGSAAPPNSDSGDKPPDAAPRGDVSQMIERLPKISVSALKSGDAVVVSGAEGADKSALVATNVIAGVEPIFQSSPPRQGRSLGGDWNLDAALPAQ